MTAIAMIAGMIPMALGLGEGGEQTAPLGRAVIGGLARRDVRDADRASRALRRYCRAAPRRTRPHCIPMTLGVETMNARSFLPLLFAAAAFSQSARTVEVVSRSVDRTLKIPGELLPYQTVDIHARVNGYIEKMLADRGTVVARIRSSPCSARLRWRHRRPRRTRR